MALSPGRASGHTTVPTVPTLPTIPTVPTDVSVAMLDDDLFSLLTPTETLGFVHKVGPVFVALRGSDLPHAVEVGQSLDWNRAIELVRAA